jgi:hypothetical protein
MNAELQAVCVQALNGVVRLDIDLVQIVTADEYSMRLAVVLPETGSGEVAVIRARARAALMHTVREHFPTAEDFGVSVGAVSFDSSLSRNAVTVDDFMAVADNCRLCLASCGETRLTAVQASVVKQLAIPCRHGYAVADHCLEVKRRQSTLGRTDVDVGSAAATI